MSVRYAYPFSGPLAAALALAASLTLSPGLMGCSHRSYRDGPPAPDETVAGSLLGARPWILPPDAAGLGGHLFYPLAIGNRWDYNVHTQTVLVTSDGRQPPLVTDVLLRDEIVGMQQIGERIYFMQLESSPVTVAPSLLPSTTIPLREDRSGLYERDLVTASAPANSADRNGASALVPAAIHAYVDRVVSRPAERAGFERAYERLSAQLAAARWSVPGPMSPNRGGPDPGEISLLRYPLFTGARWVVRESPRFLRVVVGRERILVPAGAFVAWRLLGLSELFGPNDRVALWYSSAGLVRIRIHAEAVATDDTGNPIGHIESDQEQVLTALKLVDPNAVHALAVAPVGGAEPR